MSPMLPNWRAWQRRMDEELVLRLTVEHLLTRRDWPTLADLHRRIHRDMQKDVDVRSVARRLDRHPFFSGYHDLADTFAPRLEVLARVPESGPIVDGVFAVVKHAHAKYMSSEGDVEVTITEREVREELGMPEEVTTVVRQLLDGVAWVTAGGGSGEEGWHFQVSDDITRWSGVKSKKDLIESLEAIEDHRRREYAAMSDAKAEMVRASRPVVEGTVLTSPRATHWYDTPLATGIKWTVGIAVGLLTIFVLVRQL